MILQIKAARLVNVNGREIDIETQSGATIRLNPDSPRELWRQLSDFRISGGEIIGAMPAYTIMTARVANQEGDAIVVTTEDCGDVVVTERDRPDLWQKLQSWRAAGGEVSTFVAPNWPEPEPGTEMAEELRAIRNLLIARGIATEAELQPPRKG
jgi:hypothetical protein